MCLLLAAAAAAPALAETGAGFRQLFLDGHAVRWEAAGPAGRIALTFAIADREIAEPAAINCRRLRPPTQLLSRSSLTLSAFRSALHESFERWRDVADIAFVEVGPEQKPDIVIGEQTDPLGFAFTNLKLGDTVRDGVRPIAGASICLNPQRTWKIGYDGNLDVYDLVHTFTHEIGHVIGLDHPGGRGQLMSYRYTEDHAGLSDGDKYGAISIYGASRIRSAATLPPAGRASGERAVTTVIGRALDTGDSR